MSLGFDEAFEMGGPPLALIFVEAFMNDDELLTLAEKSSLAATL